MIISYRDRSEPLVLHRYPEDFKKPSLLKPKLGCFRSVSHKRNSSDLLQKTPHWGKPKPKLIENCKNYKVKPLIVRRKCLLPFISPRSSSQASIREVKTRLQHNFKTVVL